MAAELQETHDNLVARAKLSEQSERYDDMVEVMRSAAQLGIPLSPDERNLLSVAYKNVVGSRRSSWRVISSMEQKETDEQRKKLAKDYLVTISGEIGGICTEVVNLIDNHLLKENSEEFESNTFYMKMKGDYYRYVAEVASKECKIGHGEKAQAAYNQAYEICKAEMIPPHPIRLGLALNFSVFYYEILDERKMACEIARKAFDDAITDMDKLSPNSFKDSSLIMQLLRDNLTLWSAAEEDQAELEQQCQEDEEQEEQEEQKEKQEKIDD